MKLLFSFLICIGISTTYAVEKNPNKSPWSGGVTIGGANFLRTFNMTGKTGINHYKEDLNFSFGLSASRTLNDVISLEGEWLNGKLSGTWNDKGYPQSPPSTYKTNFKQLTVSGLFNLNKLIKPNRSEKPWYIFGKAGLGTSFLDGKSNGSTGNHVSFIVPVGLGVNYKINDKFDVALASTVNFGNDWLNSGQEWVASGNTYIETFLNTGIKISYRFNKRKQRKTTATPVQPIVKQTPSSVKKADQAPNRQSTVKEQQKKDITPVPPKKSTTKPEQPTVENKFTKSIPSKKDEVNKGIIGAQPDWKIYKGVVFGELPLDGVTYHVQVLATYIKIKSEEKASQDLLIDGPFIEYRNGRLYNYAVKKDFTTYKSAQEFSNKLNKTGKYKDTFVVAFKNNLQIK